MASTTNSVPATVVGSEAPKQQDMESGRANMGASLAANFSNDGLNVKQTMKGCFRECCGCEDTSEYKVSNLVQDVAVQDPQMLSVAVPPGSGPGSQVQIQIQSGPMNVVVPEGVQEGETFQVQLPTPVAPVAQPTTEQPQSDHMYALEQSSFIQRCCWPGGRAMTINVTTGSEKGGELIVKYKKPCGMPICGTIPILSLQGLLNSTLQCTFANVPCCCMLPEMTAVTPQEQTLGTSKYICDMCLLVPKFGYYEEDKMVYYVAPPTCCNGACIEVKCGSKTKMVYIPFYIRDPDTKEPFGNPDSEDCPSIQKLWSGMKKECCSDADNFAIRFPKGITPERKAGLLGLNFLIDAVWFETQRSSWFDKDT